MGAEQKPAKPTKAPEQQKYTPGFGQGFLKILAGQHVDAIPGADEAAEALNRGEAVVLDVREVFARIAQEQSISQCVEVKPKA